MKYIKNFEGFDINNLLGVSKSLFGRKVDVTEEPELDVIDIQDEIEEIPVRWTGAYIYNGDHIMLQVGDYTNKGVITEISNDIHTSFITDEGVFNNPEELIVYKGSKEAIERYIDSKKYNL